MYCRQCNYDLRALTTNRCPECGKAFDPNNPDSFYLRYPSFFYRVKILIEYPGWRAPIFVVFCLFWFGVLLLPASRSARGGPAPLRRREQRISQALLNSIMMTWRDQQKASERSSTVTFDKEAASKTLGRGVSPWTDPDVVRCRKQVQDFVVSGQIVAVLLVPPLALVALFWRGNVRRVAVVPLSLLVFVGLISLPAERLTALIVPGTHAYLHDYVYLTNVDLLHPTGRIAAYDFRSFDTQDWWRVIALDDGRVEILGDVDAKSLFEQQGIPYPAPQEAQK